MYSPFSVHLVFPQVVKKYISSPTGPFGRETHTLCSAGIGAPTYLPLSIAKVWSLMMSLVVMYQLYDSALWYFYKVLMLALCQKDLFLFKKFCWIPKIHYIGTLVIACFLLCFFFFCWGCELVFSGNKIGVLLAFTKPKTVCAVTVSCHCDVNSWVPDLRQRAGGAPHPRPLPPWFSYPMIKQISQSLLAQQLSLIPTWYNIR